MIQQNQFHKPLLSLSNEEMETYLTTLQDYLSEQLPRIQGKTDWSDYEANIFDQGLILISAFIRAKDFCINAYKFSSAEKRIKNLLYYVGLIKSFLQGRGIIERDEPRSATMRHSHTGSLVIGASFIAPKRTGGPGRPTKPRNYPVIASAGAKDQLLRSPDGDDPLRQTLATRPRHLHDYIDQLPHELQQEALGIRDLYDQLNDEAHKLETLCSDPTKSTQKDRAFHAAKLCNVEDKLRNLWARIDAAYAESTGNTVSEDYKAFLNSENIRINGLVKEPQPCEISKFDIDNMPDGEEKDAIRTARIERNKKFLRKTDRKGDSRHKQNLMDAARELHEWGIAITDSQVECCKKYGYDVPEDWQELPLEERKRLRQQARNEQRRADRAAARAEKEAAKQAAIEEMQQLYQASDLTVFNDD